MGKGEESQSLQVTKSYKRGVKISVYVESPTICFLSQNKDHFKRIKPHSVAKRTQPACRTSGYCRRSQLLAYARELRDSHNNNNNKAQGHDHQQQELNTANHPPSKSNKWRWLVSNAFLPRSVRSRLPTRKKKKKKIWNYEAVASDETDISRDKCKSHLTLQEKLMKLLKDLFSCGCRR